MTGGAPDLREQVAAVALVVATSQGAGRGEEAHEGVGLIERRLVDLRVGDGIDARGNRRSADRSLGGLLGVRNALLGEKRAGVELAQRREVGLAAEATDPAVGGPVGAPGDAVAVAIVGIRAGEDLRLGHRVEQAAAEHRRRRPEGAGGARGKRLLGDSQRSLKRGRRLLLDHRPALTSEVVAHVTRRVVSGGVNFDLVAAAARQRGFVALGT